jgi:hypothetical protein
MKSCDPRIHFSLVCGAKVHILYVHYTIHHSSDPTPTPPPSLSLSYSYSPVLPFKSTLPRTLIVDWILLQRISALRKCSLMLLLDVLVSVRSLSGTRLILEQMRENSCSKLGYCLVSRIFLVFAFLLQIYDYVNGASAFYVCILDDLYRIPWLCVYVVHNVMCIEK